MPINVNDPEYSKAEVAFHEASSPDDQLMALNKMISHAPSHKGAENLRQQLTTRRKKLETQIEKKKRSGKSTKVGIRKGDMQAIIVGKTNSGKSSLLKTLTNANPKINSTRFTTNEPLVGMMNYSTTQIQIVEIPAVDGEHFEKSLTHTADTVIILINTFEELEKLEKDLYMITGKKIIVLNKSDKISPQEKRKLKAKLQSKKYNFEIITCLPSWPDNNIENLKEKIFNSFDILRIYTKEPGKPKSPRPVILKPKSTVRDIAEKILKGLSKRVKKTKIRE